MNMLERAARALESVAFGYNINLVRLVDGVSTYELRYSDSDEVYTFNDTDDAYEHVAERKRMTQARAVLAAIREPDDATASRAIDIAYETENAMSGETCPVMRNHIRSYVDAILEGESK